MITCVVLEVGVPQVVAWPDHQRGAQLEGTPARFPLAMARSEGPDSGRQGIHRDERAGAEAFGSGDLGGRPIFVEEHGERHSLVLDERSSVSTSTGADGGDAGSRGNDLFVSIADLTGPLAARQSAKVPQKENDLGSVGPEVPEADRGVIGSDEPLVRQGLDVEASEF